MNEGFYKHSKEGRSSKSIAIKAELQRYLKHVEVVVKEEIDNWLGKNNRDKVLTESDFRTLLSSLADRIGTPKDSSDAGEVNAIILSILQKKIERELDFSERLNLQMLLGEFFVRPAK